MTPSTRIGPPALVLAAVVAGSLVPTAAVDAGTAGASVLGVDKLLHGFGYAAIAASAAWALRRDDVPTLLAVLALAATVGLGVEWAQGFVPGRDPSALDALANTLGATLGVVAWRVGGDRIPLYDPVARRFD